MASEQQAMVPVAAGGFSLRPLLLLLGIAGAVAAGVAIMLWWRGPNWSLLYGNLSDSDANQVVQSLQASGIQYKLSDSGGSVMVPADRVHEARLQLASQGLPEASNSGVDLISKESGLGVSQFMEGARYQRALESELARTISSLRSVAAARVHLAMAQQTAFVRDRHPASASVLLQLRPGGRLEDEQVQAIVHLVASSIPELDPKQVTVVDQQGRLLSAPGSAGASVSNERYELAHRIEDSYVQRIQQLLAPMVGAEGVRAQVTVDIDAGATEESREQYQPQSQVVRSEQTSEELSRNGAAANGGVPGALSNQPPAGGTLAAANAAPVTAATTGAAGAAGAPGAAGAAGTAAAAGAAAGAAPSSESRQATRNFEIDRTLSYSHEPGGKLSKLTVAVLLDNVHKTGADGKPTSEPLSAAQIEDITRLVKGAVGYDEKRGDSVSVVNATFRSETTEVTPESTPIWQKPWVWDIARFAIGAVLLLLILMSVLRPMIRSLTAPPAGAVLAGSSASAGPAAAASAESGAAVAAVAAPAVNYDQQITQAKTLVAQDPKRVAQVVKTWVGD